MSEASLCQSAGPSFPIRVLAQIMTGFHFIESVGATIVLWFCPSLAPEPRIHQYIASTPGSNHGGRCQHRHHHHHHHHQQRITHRRDRGSPDDSENYFGSSSSATPCTSATDSSDPATPDEDAKAYISES
ncbi:hypothetical protein M413DRAFT_22184 [Hebeloma cylindrosporum]|uniref:Uncharacterized protein n=1 Tax=Hebeloma cylindrosporum TaxID=76867 RepID=A0A0C2Z2P0_HEBCY|nr:hypothetical protein M413DRAFT_22184 [Hebeloma cylindrosporum h7]